MKTLASAQVKHFRDAGFLAISGFFDEEELSAIADAHDSAWRDLPDEVVVDVEVSGRRKHIKDVTEEERHTSLKVNDLYLRDGRLREVVLSRRLGDALRMLLREDPVVCNTLSVDYGTQQADHLDTLFMTPQTPGHLVATWVALEDVDPQAGPLRYFPESNHIEPYRFAGGGYHVVQQEMDRWGDYMAGQIERHGLAETTFSARRGDLFIWDAWLLHGGSEIRTPGLTRRSLITHYYSRRDCESLGAKLGTTGGGYWLDRAPQAVPPAPVDEPEAEGPGLSSPTGRQRFRSARSLRERLDLLKVDHH